MVHVILLAAFAVSALKIKGKGSKNYALLFSFGILFLLAAFRYGYGNDYFGYEKIFVDAHEGMNSAGVETLFYWLNKLSPSYQLLIALFSLLYLFAVYRLIRRFTDEKLWWLSVFIFLINPYLFLMSLSAIRQTLALSLFMLGLLAKPKNHLVKIAICVGCIAGAILVHQTAILLIPFYLIYQLKRNNLADYLFFGLVPIVLLLSQDLLLKVAEQVIKLFPNGLNYVHYLTTAGSNSLRSTLLFSIFYIYVLLNLKRLDEKTYPIAKFYLFGLLFALLSYKFTMFGRFQMYFDIFGVVTLPAIVKANLQAKHTPFWRVVYVYLFPCAVFGIYILRYYSFFTTPLWEPFFTYRTVFFPG